MKNKQPDIRFYGYKDSWVTTKLKTIADFSKGSGYKKSDIKLSGTPVILYGSLYTNYQTIIEDIRTYAEKKEKIVLSEGDEVIVPSSGESSEDISRASVIKNPGVIIGGDLNIIRTNKKIDSVFLALTISNGNQKKELVRRAQGKSVVHLHNSDLSQVKLTHPNIQEQQKIGEFFKQLDDRIALQQRHVEQLKQSKQGFLQKMFPKDGESMPEVRFKEFSEKWGYYKLGDMKDVRDGTHESPKYQLEGHPLVTSKNLKDNGLDLNEVSLISDLDFEAINRRSKVNVGDILFGMIGTIGNPVLIERDDFAIKNVALIKENEKVKNQFLNQLLKSPVFDKYIRREIAGNTQKFLGLSKIRNFQLHIPIVEEQQKIAEFFKQLDDLIAENERELELLQETKKGFLQKMFV